VRYVLGTEAEQMRFSDDGIGYEPGGAAHAIDTGSSTFKQDAAVGYAVCGRPVRVWQDHALDGSADMTDEECAAALRDA
jgi:hypothetical protein